MLTDTTIKNAKPKDKPYRMADEKALYLEVMPNGSKYFRMKYRIDGKEKRLAFGGKRYRKSNTPNLKSLGCSLRRAGRKQPMTEYKELQGQGGEIRGLIRV